MALVMEVDLPATGTRDRHPGQAADVHSNEDPCTSAACGALGAVRNLPVAARFIGMTKAKPWAEESTSMTRGEECMGGNYSQISMYSQLPALLDLCN